MINRSFLANILNMMKFLFWVAKRENLPVFVPVVCIE